MNFNCCVIVTVAGTFLSERSSDRPGRAAGFSFPDHRPRKYSARILRLRPRCSDVRYRAETASHRRLHTNRLTDLTQTFNQTDSDPCFLNLPAVEANGGDSTRPAFLQLILEVPSKSSPEEGGQPDQRGGWREGISVHCTDDIIIQGHDITQLRLQQTLPVETSERFLTHSSYGRRLISISIHI